MKVQKLNVKDPQPSVRSGHRLVSVGLNSLVLFGGYMSHRINGTDVADLKQEIWRLHTPTLKWTKLVTTGEFPHSTASCAVISHSNYIIVFGGSGSTFGTTNSSSLHILELTSLTWKSMKVLGEPLEEGYGHSISINKGHLYIYGGCNGHHFYNTMHKITLATWENKTFFRGHGGGKYRHESVSYKNKIYIIGGGTSTTVDDMSKLPFFCTDINKWFEKDLNAVSHFSQIVPEGRIAHSCNILENLVFIAGGHYTVTHEAVAVEKRSLFDIWILDLDIFRWTKLGITLPYGLFFHSAAFSNEHDMFIFGGSKYILENNSRIPVNKRVNDLFKITTMVPSLLELAWTVFSEMLHVRVSGDELIDAGVPPFLVERIYPRCLASPNHLG